MALLSISGFWIFFLRILELVFHFHSLFLDIFNQMATFFGFRISESFRMLIQELDNLFNSFKIKLLFNTLTTSSQYLPLMHNLKCI